MRSIITILVFCLCANIALGGMIVLPQNPDRIGKAYAMGQNAILPNPNAPFSEWIDGAEDISIWDATIDLEGIIDSIADLLADDGGGPMEPQQIDAGQLSDMEFLLEGICIDWAPGALPTSSGEAGMHMETTQIPEPASIIMVIMVSGMGLFIRRRFRQ